MYNTSKSDVLNYVESVMDLAVLTGDFPMLAGVQDEVPNIFEEVAIRMMEGEPLSINGCVVTRKSCVTALFLECSYNEQS